MPRLAYLAAGTVVAAVLLHSVLLPLVRYEQVSPMSAYLQALDMDQDNDGIADPYDKLKEVRNDKTMPIQP